MSKPTECAVCQYPVEGQHFFDCPSHLEDEYTRREVEEGITPHDLSADDADWQGYSGDKGVRS